MVFSFDFATTGIRRKQVAPGDASKLLRCLISVRRGYSHVGRQWWQGKTRPAQPLLKHIRENKPCTELLLKHRGSSEGELPALTGTNPAPSGTDPTQLRLRDRIERTHHPNQARRGQIQITTGRALVRDQPPQTITLKRSARKART